MIHADGTPAPGHDAAALAHYLAEGTPLRSAAAAGPRRHAPGALARDELNAPPAHDGAS